MSLAVGEELEVHPVSVRPEELVFVRHLLEASEGLGFLIARRGGDALLVNHRSRGREMAEFIADLREEIALRTEESLAHREARSV